jgi:adenylylsulfate kinase-like enzyme
LHYALCINIILGVPAYGLDGDDLRKGLSKDLGYSPIYSAENIRRVSEVGKLFAGSGHVTLCSFVSPFTKVSSNNFTNLTANIYK